MRRLLLPALLLPLAVTFAPAGAEPCGDPETDECHPYDCIAWEPVAQLPDSIDRAVHGDIAGGVQALLPPPCPPA